MSEDGEGRRVRPVKGAAAFRTIGEVAEDLDLPAHVLRFWEAKFPQLKPLKRRGGRRYYRPEDVALLRRIRQCLYQDGYTIRGVQRLLGGGEREPRGERDPPPSLFPLEPEGGTPTPAEPPRRLRQRLAPANLKPALTDIRRELNEARALLDALLRRGNASG